MKNVTLRQLQKVTMGRLFHAAGVMDVEISAIVSDSRKVRDDCLFICIKGAKADGHDFAQTVIENGALAVVSEKELPGFEGPYLLVDSTFEATKAIAQYYREQLDVVFIGVTGSVGKTSTKEFIAEVLSRRYRVHKTQGNLNNEWGVPFTIFRIKEGTDVAVIEMGINHFGEMDRLAKMVQPDIVVMTNIGQSH
ncbi:MAG: UDP-N-acetylmuramoyl-tripeptide--D-alanyl-D-alanine ligase, partial [Lachnospiraceae bacterium]|nr:UDP-N-acetylmuramoyl-tripeptide--D-alanyl-D-alanine ligase [Lachnospiraceae bacterium]